MVHERVHVQVVGSQVWDPVVDNVDVEAVLPDGRRYGATFFTLRNIQRLFEKNRATGECLGGVYLWAANMILGEELTMEVIRRTVEDLLDTEEFFSVFSRLDDL
ncbi:MAG: hypothetical protein V2A73_07330 [Pseudomonadota bacterium]